MLCKTRHSFDSSFVLLLLVFSLTVLGTADFQKVPILCFGPMLQPVSRYRPVYALHGMMGKQDNIGNWFVNTASFSRLETNIN